MYICDKCQDENDAAELLFLAEQIKNIDKTRFQLPDEICEGLYLGSKDSSYNKEILLSMNIKQIIVCCGCLPAHFVPRDHHQTIEEVPTDEHITYLRLPVQDNLMECLTPYFEASIEFINEGKEKRQCATLVHCHAGISRSATVVTAYLMKMQSMKYQEAYDFVKSKRKCIFPNSAFRKQLQLYENALLNQSTST